MVARKAAGVAEAAREAAPAAVAGMGAVEANMGAVERWEVDRKSSCYSPCTNKRWHT